MREKQPSSSSVVLVVVVTPDEFRPALLDFLVVSRDVGLNRNFLAFSPQRNQRPFCLAITSPALALFLSLLTTSHQPTNLIKSSLNRQDESKVEKEARSQIKA
ncbi:hypothetical protein TWF173_005562 [Orbilia oligospora]|nr:hypothetical protein TWF173_005562 [Orbilia oligospora]